MAREALSAPFMLLVLIAAAVGAGAAPLPAASDPEAGSPCADPVFVRGLGRACVHPSGLYEVVGDDGASLGFVHRAADPAPSPAEIAASRWGATRPAVCADPATEPFHGIVIYAHAADNPSRYAARADVIRHLVGQANHMLNAAAQARGTTADYRMRCDADGRVSVDEVLLPTPRAATTFESIVQDLYAHGYVDGRTKLWVWFEGHIDCDCGGWGHILPDQDADVKNANNGLGIRASGTLYARGGPAVGVTFGYLSARIMMHENGHNLGAVQDGAPHTTRGGHCWDGRDIMCYNDGAEFGHKYSWFHCRGEVFDCNHDDYFDPRPEPGSYLARYWNLAAPVNRYLLMCHEATETVPGGAAALGVPVVGQATFPVPDACRGKPAAAWAADVATQTGTYYPVEICWRDGTGARLGCDAFDATNVFAVWDDGVTETRSVVPNVAGVTAEVRVDAGGPAVVWFKVS